MVMLVTFCTNAINILAGVNGLEAGQTFIIACAVTFHNLWILAGHGADSPSVRDGHLFSLYLMLPLATTTLALLVFNWYPSQARTPAPSHGLTQRAAIASTPVSQRCTCHRHGDLACWLASTQCWCVDRRHADANAVHAVRRSLWATHSHTLRE